MTDRRSIIDGLNSPPQPKTEAEKNFVYQGTREVKSPTVQLPSRLKTHARTPLSTRIRSDLAANLKKASLERQLSGMEPQTVQEILEEALQTWLDGNGNLESSPDVSSKASINE